MRAEFRETVAESDAELGAGKAEVVLDLADAAGFSSVEAVTGGDHRPLDRSEAVQQTRRGGVQAHEIVVGVGCDIDQVFELIGAHIGIVVGIRPTLVARPRIIRDP